MSTTDLSHSSFVKDLMSAVKAAKPNVTPETSALVIAHAAYESGWGRAKAAREGFNYWNLTAGSAWTGPVLLGSDTEYRAGSSQARPITQKFRKYITAMQACGNYFQFLQMPRYKDAFNKLMRGESTFVVDLGAFKFGPDGKTAVPAWPAGAPKGGFYTLPIERYCEEFRKVLLEVQQLLASNGVPGSCK